MDVRALARVSKGAHLGLTATLLVEKWKQPTRPLQGAVSNTRDKARGRTKSIFVPIQMSKLCQAEKQLSHEKHILSMLRAQRTYLNHTQENGRRW